MDSHLIHSYISRRNASGSRHMEYVRVPRHRKRLNERGPGKLCKESVSEEPPKFDSKKLSLFNHVRKRDIYGLNEIAIRAVVSKHLSTAMPNILSETELDLGHVNKVFASKWISDSKVVMGTKCNKIIITDVQTNETVQIPTIEGTGETPAPHCPCGIHALSLNPSKTYLATGAERTNDLAVYRLPSFDPVFLGEGGHSDWIFDLEWVDDEYCITGSRDSKIALWKVEDNEWGNDDVVNVADPLLTPSLSQEALPALTRHIKKPESVKHIKNADKIRSVAYNAGALELGVLSMDSKVHTIDVSTFEMKKTHSLTENRETVCMAYDAAKQVYAVGSQSYVTLLDRDLKPVLNIEALKKGCGIRSLTFKENIITIGTGVGSVLFYDMNAGKYLQCACGHNCELNASHGYLLRDEMWRDNYPVNDHSNAIYTHCYDDTGSRLFTAGGPLPASLVGNYAAIWQ